eukprot:s744_g19.t1
MRFAEIFHLAVHLVQFQIYISQFSMRFADLNVLCNFRFTSCSSPFTLCSSSFTYGSIRFSSGTNADRTGSQRVLQNFFIWLFILCSFRFTACNALQSSASLQEVLGIGSFLLPLWSGLTFTDLQRTRLSNLAYDLISLRGLSYRPLTCPSGYPFGVLCKRFLSTGSFAWVHHYPQALDGLHSRHGRRLQDGDFVIPSIDSLNHADGPGPMTSAAALSFCGHFLSLPWLTSPVTNVLPVQPYNMHGLKSPLLSFAHQLHLAPELRRLQGKRKDPMPSPRLYSRDDVNGSLQLQAAIVRIPASFDAVLIGVYRTTWNVALALPPEEGVPPDWTWNTACGKSFAPDHFALRAALALAPGHILCSHPGCKKGWISVETLP